MTPDGAAAYLDRGGAPQCGAEVVHLDLATGDERVVARGAQPALSPDGSRLAYVGCAEGATFPDRIVVHTLDDDRERAIVAGSERIPQLPSWMPDSRHLVYQLVADGDDPLAQVVDARDATDLDAGRPVPVADRDNLFLFGVRGRTGELLALRAPQGEGERRWGHHATRADDRPGVGCDPLPLPGPFDVLLGSPGLGPLRAAGARCRRHRP